MCAFHLASARKARMAEGSGSGWAPHPSSPSSREPWRGSGDVSVLSWQPAKLQTPCCSPEVSGFETRCPPGSGFVLGSPHPFLTLCCRLVPRRPCRRASAVSQSRLIGLSCFYSRQRGGFGGSFPTLAPGLCVHQGKG